MKTAQLKKYQQVQNIAKQTIDYLCSYIKEGLTEKNIVDRANKFMMDKGVTSFWYHGVGSYVLVGKRTLLSISGREYIPSTVKVDQNDLVTVDLAPEIDFYWGDFARSFIIENGKVITSLSPTSSPKTKEMFKGMDTEKLLHKKLKEVASPNKTLEELYFRFNKIIKDLGYINLDFKGNLGHSIEKNKDDRIYIEKGNKKKLSEAGLFTFEPHIKRKGGSFGYKMEDIYHFDREKLHKL